MLPDSACGSSARDSVSTYRDSRARQLRPAALRGRPEFVVHTVTSAAWRTSRTAACSGHAQALDLGRCLHLTRLEIRGVRSALGRVLFVDGTMFLPGTHLAAPPATLRITSTRFDPSLTVGARIPFAAWVEKLFRCERGLKPRIRQLSVSYIGLPTGGWTGLC